MWLAPRMATNGSLVRTAAENLQMLACVLACVRACVLACLRACVLACLRACVLARRGLWELEAATELLEENLTSKTRDSPRAAMKSPLLASRLMAAASRQLVSAGPGKLTSWRPRPSARGASRWAPRNSTLSCEGASRE